MRTEASAAELVAELEARGIYLRAEGGQLKVRAAKGALTAELREVLTQRKAEVLEFLAKAGSGVKGAGADGRAVGGDAMRISRIERSGDVALSFAQERIWFLEQLAPGGSAYHVPAALELTGALDVDALRRSFSELVRRHEALRTVFPVTNGQPAQRVLAAGEFALACEAVAGEDEARAKVTAEVERAFDLERGPLLRARLLKLSAERHWLVVVAHHLISDGWSVGLMVRELTTGYESSKDQAPRSRETAKGDETSRGGRGGGGGEGEAGGEIACKQAPTAGVDVGTTAASSGEVLQYADYAAWQRVWLASGVKDVQLAYWKERLGGERPALALPEDRLRPEVLSGRGATAGFALSAEATAALREAARAQGATLFMAVLAGYAGFLARLSGQVDLVVGTPVANRPRAELEGVVGLFVNTLALRVDVSGNPNLDTLIARAKETCLEAYARQDVPFEAVVDAVASGRDLGRSPVFQTMLILQNAPAAAVDLPGLTVSPLELELSAAKVELTLTLVERADGGLEGIWEYSTDLFTKETIARWSENFARMLADAATRPGVGLSRWELAGARDAALLAEWNRTERVWSGAVVAEGEGESEGGGADGDGNENENGRGALAGAGFIHEEFVKRAKARPSAVALVFEGESMTYGELARRTEMLARYLRGGGVKADELVGVCLERSFEMVVALMGIVRAGAAYVPIDPEYPRERVAHMLEDSGVRVVLAQEKFGGLLEEAGASAARRVEFLDREWAEVEAGAAGVELEGGVSAERAAYAIYTSGSTGRPKGAVNTHGAIRNRLLWMQAAYPLTGDDRVLQKTPFSFDVSVWEFFWPLMVGARLVLAQPGGHRDGRYLVELIRREGITTLHFVPSMLQAFLEEPEAGTCGGLRRVICSGEALPGALGDRFFATLGGAELHNLYGPTEAAVDVTYFACSAGDRGANVPIGRPIANTQIHIVDTEGAAAAVGVAGELLIGGEGLARGYLGRPELTAEKFVPDPFSGVRGARLYRTGDLARWRSDGQVEYLGRLDHQVKIRGFRIELGEIESVLAAHPSVRDVVVVVRAVGGENRLAAYVAGRAGATVDAAELRAWAGVKLPDYMVPAAVVELSAMPLLPNGKLDRKALPEPEWSAGQGAEDREQRTAGGAPRTPEEQMLAESWREVLGVEAVGIRDNFFERGGHSLLATRLMARVRRAFGVELPLRVLFEAPTIAGLAERIRKVMTEGGEGEGLPPLTRRPAEAGNEAPLSFMQERLWFLEQLAPGRSTYHMPVALRLRGALDVAALEESFTALVRRHEALRTVFRKNSAGRPVQVVLAAPEKVAVRRIAEADIAAEVARPFRLGEELPIRAALVERAVDEWLLVVVMHHLVSDGWSMEVIVREVSERYAAAAAAAGTAASSKLQAPRSRETASGGEGAEGRRETREKDSDGLLRRYAPRNDRADDGVMSDGRVGRPGADLKRLGYPDFAYWQRGWLTGEVLERRVGFWKTLLGAGGELPVLGLPADFVRPAVWDGRGGHVAFAVPAEVVEGLREVGRREGTTLFMTLLAAYLVFLNRETGQEDIVVGTPVANRALAETEGMVGFFVNTLALRARVSGAEYFRDVLARVRADCLAAFAHQDVPFESVVEALMPERDLSRTPVYQTLFVLEQNARATELRLPGLVVEAEPVESATAKCDLTMTLVERAGGGLEGVLEYGASVYRAETARRWAEDFGVMLAVIAREAGVRVGAVDGGRWTVDSGRATVDGGRGAEGETVLAQVERWARETPGAVALADGARTLTYEEMDMRAEALAERLRAEWGVGAEKVVAVCLERSAAWVIALLGIWKAGGAYLPLDARQPAERLRGMVADARAVAVIREAPSSNLQPPGKHQGPSEGLRGGVWAITRPAAGPMAAGTTAATSESPASRLLHQGGVGGESLAYVIYTSGSTGRPKGVMISHGNLAQLVRWHRRAFAVTEKDVATQVAGLGFDAAGWEVWPYLASGAAVHVVPAEVVAEPVRLRDFLVATGVTIAFLPTPLAEACLGLEWAGARDHRGPLKAEISETADAGAAGSGDPALHRTPRKGRLRYLLTGGDRLHAAPRAGLPFEVVNNYGPTESTVVATSGVVPAAAGAGEGAPAIGWAIDGTRVYIVDTWMNPVPVGAPGELCLGGTSLGRGYLGRAELTAERFWPDPFSAEAGARLYRTGDLARFRADGQLEFLGRIDQQVKIRGVRIELGEIEAVLREEAGGAEAVVVARAAKSGEARLVGYVVGGENAVGVARETGGLKGLRERLKARLPEAMVPAQIVTLAALPLTPNGKVDRRALPEPVEEETVDGVGFVAPREGLEAEIARIWCEVLGRTKVGARDNFFDLGGHSLLILRVQAALQKVLGREIAVVELFEHPTVAALAARFGGGETKGSGMGEGGAEAAVAKVSDEAARRAAQQRAARERFKGGKR